MAQQTLNNGESGLVVRGKINDNFTETYANAAAAAGAASTAQSTANGAASSISTHVANVSNPHSVTKTQVGLGNVPNLAFSGSNTGDQDLSGLVTKEDFTVLTYASTVNWDTLNKQSPLAKVTATGNFILNMTNVKSGSTGILKITMNTASTVTVTFDSDFTNKTFNSTITTYAYPALTAQEYYLTYTVDGTTIEWNLGDPTGTYGIYGTWSPTFTGFSVDPTVVARYSLIGKMCTIWVTATGNGTSNATGFTMTAPFAAASFTSQHFGIPFMINSGSPLTTQGRITLTASSTAMTLSMNSSSTGNFAWTASGGKSASFSFTYEIL